MNTINKKHPSTDYKWVRILAVLGLIEPFIFYVIWALFFAK